MAVEFKLGLHTIGFVRFLQNDKIQAMGSGTCVRFGKLRGILTADHLVDKWNNDTEVGLVQFPISEKKFQRTRLLRKHLDEVRVGFKPYDDDDMGPDIAFVKLPIPEAGSIEAVSSFFDFEKQIELATKPAPESSDQYDFIAGIIEKWQGQPTVKGRLATTVINGLLNVGNAVPIADGRQGYDRMLFTPKPEPGFELPPTYGATSGGGLIRLFLEKGTKNLIELRLLGPVYYESAPKVDEVRDLVCHGPGSTYDLLASSIRARWGDEI
jgi:hypothetical protein